MTMNQDIKQRALAIGLPFKTWARLASQSDMTIHSPEISNWFDNYPMREEKQKRLLAALAAVEDLVAADPEVRIDLTSAANIRAAQKRLAQKRNAPAVAPWKFRGATATPEESVGALAIAGQTLAGATAE